MQAARAHVLHGVAKKNTKLKVTLFLNIYTCIIFVYTLRYQQCFSLHGGIRVISFFLASVII